jgi:hypothetical protein
MSRAAATVVLLKRREKCLKKYGLESELYEEKRGSRKIIIVVKSSEKLSYFSIEDALSCKSHLFPTLL